MAKSRKLTVGQVRAVHRLIDQCREMGDDPGRWQRHLLCGVHSLVGAVISTAMEVVPEGEIAPNVARVVDDSQPASSALTEIHPLLRGQWAVHPIGARLVAFSRLRVTCTRREMFTDDDWYRSPFYLDLQRPHRLDDGIASYHTTSDGWGFVLSPVRADDDAPFDRRASKLIHYLLLELSPHLGRSLATSRDPVARLSPKLRQTLDALLDGDGEKQVAARVGVRPATVREYVQALYRQFGVNSRAELMAYFLRRYRRSERR
jgi:DNA-binding CsgD family transcriptional regulator